MLDESRLPKDLAAVWNHMKNGGRSHTWILRAFVSDPAKAVQSINLDLIESGDRRLICSRPMDNGTRVYWAEEIHWRSWKRLQRKAG